ncbi:bifunctional acetaldehyde-CoA/alcohol dehydrogenase [Staphylococcus epidermidis]|jgi:alcohol dehydrogenase, iron-dependent|uniref:bifunctional acetaldehyde-CoA/alcohol dehydrogenase n=1 Tax=Staphylococcus epidermidis TaxID=1282 RepID=UPI0003677EA6|nr:bifunctional acetaldehyde-CoA/alcohol dehydrogenase [Staphylococcus epidermidis]MBM0783274.1 bifunctional acetaldehyde-CoA/alcohol dehydrogenase [Staphylococcus epidermidis]MBM0807250.1 bifunctional acetaldehyde-CoA/alcohol dehydrogenase [Staphylococcus epidermidis]MBM0814661.1 bifunctional acetaldehyde-CoA/alcohol dehydrogenase [Staphylococcus epidermidis]MBM5970289.1 bifunctional acetaldehyde-CoA/alcohol dehydrogenase [Staphylococcus epidermidis]MBM6077712.1 bifunctional acetaldehyde-CoA/
MLSVTKKNTYESNKDEVTQMIDSLAEKGQEALKELSKKSQHEINDIVHQMSMAAVDQHMHLAKLAYDETGRGIYEDKAIKNLYASEYIWNSIKDNKTVGIIGEDKQKGLTYVAESIGVICGVTPTTNPTSTTIFKAMIAIKTGNPIIFAFHPSAQQSSKYAAKVILEAATKAGAPKDCIQWIEVPSIEATKQLMNHKDIALVLATGGSGMVKSAYSTGKPALGVGPGNVPTYIEKTAHIKRAVNDIIGSKTFDNGMICASEQVMVVDKEVYTDVVKEFKLHQTYFVNKNELQQLEDAIMNEDKTAVKPDIVGKSAVDIAKLSGISVPEKTKLLVAEIDGIGKDYPLSREKLSPVLAMVTAKSTGHALQICEDTLKFGGLGHTAVIHTEDSQLQQKFGLKMKACRVLVNTPSAVGGIGNMYNELIPSLTLGCGSYGRNSISHNVSAVDLLNIKTIAKRRNNMQWFKLPPKVYFEENSVMYLTEMDNVERVMIVCDPGMVNIGYTDIVEQVLRRRENQPQIKVFNEVEPNPSTHTVYKGLDMFINFQPDTIIALGGGSAMDAAKAIWMFFEHPETSFFGAKQKFLDIRKRTYKITKPKNAKFICIPTTSGTGSEVTPFAVITDSETHVKYPLADYALTPDIAIVDPQFVLSVPKDVAADTGMDVLTHAIESYVSVMASDYTRGLSLQAIKLTFDYLKSSVQENDKHSREKMHNASTMAGMAFANAFLGISHSIAHKIGGEYGIPHGRTNAILLPHVIRYNAKDPQKHALFPKYDFFRADTDYADIAKFLGLKGNTTEELVDALANAVYDLGCSVGIDMNLKSQGVTEELLHSTIDRMAELAFEDQCTTANPKEPLISELKGIIETAYDYER